MTRKKKIIIVLTLALIIGGIIFLAKGSKKPSEEVKHLKKPNIPDFTKESYPIESSLNQSDFSFPKEMPVLIVKPKPGFLPDEAKSIAKSSGFDREPKITQDINRSTTYIFNTDKASMVIYLRDRIIDYTLNIEPEVVNKQLSPDAIENIAKDFLIKSLQLPEEQIQFFNLLFLLDTESEEVAPLDSQEDARVYQVNFSPKISNRPIITLDPKNTPYSVQILRDGTPFAAHTTDLGEIKESFEIYKIMSFSEFNSSLPNAKLITLGDSNLSSYFPGKGGIQKLLVNQVDLAYFMDAPQSEIFQPIFLLTADAILTGESETKKAILYLPAVSGI